MKNKKNLPNREKLTVLKKKENATLIAGIACALAAFGSIPLAIAGSTPFDNKMQGLLEETGYFEYAEEKKAEYEAQYHNNEIPKGVYESYVEYYNKSDAVHEYLESIGDGETGDKVDGILKSRQVFLISVMGVGLASAFSGLFCLMTSRIAGAEIQELAETMKAEGESIEYDPYNTLDSNFEDIFPDFSKKDDEDENEESK